MSHGQHERYGDATIDASNERMMALTKDEWEAKELLEDAIKVQLRIALQTQDPQSEAAQELARMHEKWIAIHWGKGYKKQEYLSLVQGALTIRASFRTTIQQPAKAQPNSSYKRSNPPTSKIMQIRIPPQSKQKAGGPLPPLPRSYSA